MEKLCKNCEYWESSRKLIGSCVSEKFLEESEYKGKEEDFLVYGATDAYGSYFSTGPNFGCVHFKERV